MIDEVVILAGLIAWFLHAHFIPYSALLYFFEGTCCMSHWFFLSMHLPLDARDTPLPLAPSCNHVCAYFIFSITPLTNSLLFSSVLVLFFACHKHPPPPAPLSSATAEWLMINDP